MTDEEIRAMAARVCAEFLGLPVERLARIKTTSLLNGAITASEIRNRENIAQARFDLLHGRAKGRA